MATFPAYLKLDLEGFKDQPESVVQRTEMEGGLSKQMPRASKRLQQNPVVYWADSKADYVSFKTWVKDTINNGADWFNWTDPIGGGTVSARIKQGVYHGAPINSAMSRWKISLTLEFYA